MNISMYDLSITPFLRNIDSMIAIIGKAKTYCETKAIDASVLLNDRIYCDMFPLITQIQIVADQPAKNLAYLTGTTVEDLAPPEANFDTLITRLEAAKAHVASYTEAQLAGSAEAPIAFAIGEYQLSFDNGFQFLQGYAMPNFQFHFTTAYNILRKNGVELGKGDYLGNFGGQISMPSA